MKVAWPDHYVVGALMRRVMNDDGVVLPTHLLERVEDGLRLVDLQEEHEVSHQTQTGRRAGRSEILEACLL